MLTSTKRNTPFKRKTLNKFTYTPRSSTLDRGH